MVIDGELLDVLRLKGLEGRQVGLLGLFQVESLEVDGEPTPGRRQMSDELRASTVSESVLSGRPLLTSMP